MAIWTYQAFRTYDGDLRFMVGILPEFGTRKPGEMIFGVQDDEEPDDGKGLTEVQFHRVLTQHYGLSSAEADEAVQIARDGQPSL